MQSETVEHALFWCDFAKIAWQNSSLNLNSDRLQGTLREIIQVAMQWPEPMFQSFVCLAWSIWRKRNDKVHGGKQLDMGACARYFSETQMACRMGHQLAVIEVGPTVTSEVGKMNIMPEEGYKCYIDGSWSPDGLAGVGIYIIFRGSLVKWCSKWVRVLSSTHAEAKAVLNGCQMMHQYQHDGGQILSDCAEVVSSVPHKPPIIQDWRSSQEIWEAWTLNMMGVNFSLSYCNRNMEGLTTAHDLANLGRIKGWERMGSERVPSVTDGS